MKSLWNGTISFGLVQIPVKLFAAARRRELSLHFLHKDDLGRISNTHVCKKCGRSVSTQEIMRGYKDAKGDYVPLTEDELDTLSPDTSKEIVLKEFVQLQDVDPAFFAKPYWVAPEEESAYLYVLLREALKRSEKAGVARFTMHGREHLVALRAEGRTLMLHTLYFAEEIKAPKGLQLPDQRMQVQEQELEMAQQLIESLSTRFAPEAYHDTSRERLLDLLQGKQEGQKARARPRRPAATTSSEVMSKLKTSVRKAEERGKKAWAA